jgi:hypothetical protein
VDLGSAISNARYGANNIFLNTTGDVSVGIATTTAPRGKLDVEGNLGSDTRLFTLANTGATGALPYSAYIGSNGDFSLASNDNSNGSLVNASYGALKLTLGGASASGFTISSSAATTQSYNTLFKVANNGNVGVGTASPSALVDIASPSAGTAQLRFTNSASPTHYWEVGRDNVTTGALMFSSNGSELVRIATSGNVGIGTTTPEAKLAVNGGVNVNGTITSYGTAVSFAALNGGTSANSIEIGNANNHAYFGTEGNSAGGFFGNSLANNTVIYSDNGIQLMPGHNAVMALTTGGNVGIGTTSPTLPLDVVTLSQVPGVRVTSNGATGIRLDSTVTTAAWRNWAIQTNTNAGGDLAFLVGTAQGTSPISGNTALEITSGGNVGIGTTTPLTPASGTNVTIGSVAAGGGILSLDSPTAGLSMLRFYQNGADKYNIYANGNDGKLYFQNAASTNVMAIDSSGNVGIGTTTPQGVLSVTGWTRFNATASTATAPGSGKGIEVAYRTDSSNDYGLIQAYDRDASAFKQLQLSASSFAFNVGNVGIGTTTPGVFTNSIAPLTVQGSGVAQLALNGTTPASYTMMAFNGGERTWQIGIGNLSETSLGVANKFFLYDRVAGAARLTVDTSGNMGIATTTPSARLAIQASGTATDVLNLHTNTGSMGIEIREDLSGYLKQYFYDHTGATDNVFLSGEGTSYFRNSVGIGTAGASANLQVNGTSGILVTGGSNYTGLTITSAGSNRPGINFNNVNQGALGYIFGTEGGAMVLGTAVDAITINSAGNVGLGAAPPTSVYSTSRALNLGSEMVLQDVVANQVSLANNIIHNSAGNWVTLTSDYANALRVYGGGFYFHAHGSVAGGTDLGATWDSSDIRMAILNNGNVGIGTSTPDHKLTITGSNNQLLLDSGANTYATISFTSNNLPDQAAIYAQNNGALNISEKGLIRFYINDAATLALTLNTNGNATFTGTGGTCTINGSGACTSDSRLKDNIADISGADALAGLAKISGVTYNWKDHSLDQSQRVGVIAQEVLQAFPQLVGTATTTLNGVEGSYYTVNYAGLTAPLISAVNYLNTRVSALEGSGAATTTNTTFINATSTQTDSLAANNANIGTLCLGTDCRTTWPVAASAPDLSGYALLSNIPDVSSFAHLSDIPSTSGLVSSSTLASALNAALLPYATTASVNDAIATAIAGAATSTAPDLSGYATLSALNAATSSIYSAIAALPTYDLSPYAKTTDVNTAIAAAIAGIATSTPVVNNYFSTTTNATNFATTTNQYFSYSTTTADLSGYALLSDIPSLTGYAHLSDIPSAASLGNIYGSLTGNLVPSADRTYSLGSPTNRLENIYAKYVNAGDITFTETTNNSDAAAHGLPSYTFQQGDVVALYVNSTSGSTHTVPVDLGSAISNARYGANNIFLNTSGSVAIGIATTTTPRGKLDVESASTGDNRLLTLANTAATGALPYSFSVSTSTGSLVLASNENGQNNYANASYPDWRLAINGASDSFDIARSAASAAPSAASSLLRITSAGNVGIGTTTPAYPLDVYGAASAQVVYLNRPTGGVGIYQTGSVSKAYVGVSSNAAGYITGAAANALNIRSENAGIDFSANNGSTNQMHIDPTGNVGIGTTTPATLLSVGSGTDAPNLNTYNGIVTNIAGSAALQVVDSTDHTQLAVGATSGAVFIGSRTSTPVYFQVGGSNYASFDTSGNLGVGFGVTPSGLISAEKNGGNQIVARFNSSNARAGIYTSGTAGNTFFGGNLTYSSGNTFNFDKNGVAYSIGDVAGIGVFSIDTNTGTAGSDSGFGTTNNYHRFSITAAGRVGIGTTGPTTQLYVATSSAIATGIQDVATFAAGTSGSATNSFGARLVLITQNQNGNSWPAGIAGVNPTSAGSNLSDLAFYTATAGPTLNEVGRFTSTGRLGIGTNDPTFGIDLEQTTGKQLIKSTTGTNFAYLQFNNTGGDLLVGRENSAGAGLMVGSAAYAGVINVGSAHSLQLGTNNTARVTIDSSGNVGIGTSSPAFKLDIYGASPVLRITDSGSSYSAQTFINSTNGATQLIGLDNAAGNALITNGLPYGAVLENQGNFPLELGTNHTVRMLIDPSGNVGIGTTTPDTNLSVAGTTKLGNGAWPISTLGNSGQRVGVFTTSEDAYILMGNQGLTATANRGSSIYMGARNSTSLNDWTGVAIGGFKQLGDGSPGGYLTLSTMTTGNVMTERVRVDDVGNVGIGITGPSARLHVVDSGGVNGTIDFGTADHPGFLQYDNSGNTTVTLANSYDSASAAMNFKMRTGGTPLTAMSIFGNGQIGIGTTTPYTGKLDVYQDGSGGGGIPAILAVGAYTGIHVNDWGDPQYGAGLLLDNISGSATMIIDSVLSSYGRIQVDNPQAGYAGLPLVLNRDGGGVSIGTTTAPATLNVAGSTVVRYSDAFGADINLVDYSSTAGSGWLLRHSGPSSGFGNGDFLLHDYSSNTAALEVTRSTRNLIVYGTGGTCTIGNGTGGTSCTSDQRLKTNITDISGADALAGLAKISGVTYNWIDSSAPQNQQVGVIAQSVLSAFPQLVSTATTTLNGVKGSYYTVNYSGLVAPLISAVNYLNQRTNFIANNASSTQALTVDAFGNIGIKTAVADKALSVNGDAGVSGSIYASGFVAGNNGWSAAAAAVGFATSTAPSVVLTAGGAGVDIYKLAIYNLGSVASLAAQLAAQTTRMDSLEERIAKLESGAIGMATSSPFSSTTLLAALNSFGIYIQQGIAQFGTLVADRFVAATDSSGTSSAGSGTILAGNTVVEITNGNVSPSSKIFVTFTSSVSGSWYLSNKQEGSFRVSLENAQSGDVSFDYFIVETQGQIATSTSQFSAPGSSQGGTPPPPSNPPSNNGGNGDSGSGSGDTGSSTPPTPPASGDTEPPTITLNGSAAIQLTVGDAFTDAGATASDAVDGDLTSHITEEGSVDTATAGTYTLTYSVADAAGNEAHVSRLVNVAAPAAPPTPPADGGSGSDAGAGSGDTGGDSGGAPATP